jgi:hypothetical protein
MILITARFPRSLFPKKLIAHCKFSIIYIFSNLYIYKPIHSQPTLGPTVIRITSASSSSGAMISEVKTTFLATGVAAGLELMPSGALVCPVGSTLLEVTFGASSLEVAVSSLSTSYGSHGTAVFTTGTGPPASRVMATVHSGGTVSILSSSGVSTIASVTLDDTKVQGVAGSESLTLVAPRIWALFVSGSTVKIYGYEVDLATGTAVEVTDRSLSGSDKLGIGSTNTFGAMAADDSFLVLANDVGSMIRFRVDDYYPIRTERFTSTAIDMYPRATSPSPCALSYASGASGSFALQLACVSPVGNTVHAWRFRSSYPNLRQIFSGSQQTGDPTIAPAFDPAITSYVVSVAPPGFYRVVPYQCISYETGVVFGSFDGGEHEFNLDGDQLRMVPTETHYVTSTAEDRATKITYTWTIAEAVPGAFNAVNTTACTATASSYQSVSLALPATSDSPFVGSLKITTVASAALGGYTYGPVKSYPSTTVWTENNTPMLDQWEIGPEREDPPTSATVALPAGMSGKVVVGVEWIGGTSESFAVEACWVTITVTQPAVTVTAVAIAPVAASTTATTTTATTTTSTLPLEGGTSILVSGGNFTTLPSPTTVTLGTFACGSAVVVNDTALTCTVPRGAGASLVVAVTNNLGAVVQGPSVAYAPPAVSSVTPATAPAGGNTDITVHGSNFGNFLGLPTVTVGTAACTNVTAVTTVVTVPGSGGVVTAVRCRLPALITYSPVVVVVTFAGRSSAATYGSGNGVTLSDSVGTWVSLKVTPQRGAGVASVAEDAALAPALDDAATAVVQLSSAPAGTFEFTTTLVGNRDWGIEPRVRLLRRNTSSAALDGVTVAASPPSSAVQSADGLSAFNWTVTFRAGANATAPVSFVLLAQDDDIDNDATDSNRTLALLVTDPATGTLNDAYEGCR